MKKDIKKSDQMFEFRHRAEEKLKKKSKEARFPNREEDPQKLLHELEVHQIELEMQNEELKRANAEVEAGLERYSDFYDFTPVGYVSLDRNGTILNVNLTCVKLLGIERSRLLNRRFQLFIQKESLFAFNAFLREVFESNTHKTCEAALQTGSNRKLFVQLEALLSATGHECRLVVVDITERKRSEEDLKFKNVILSTQQGVSLDGILVVDEEGRTISFNQRFIDMWCIPSEAIATASEERVLQSVFNKLVDSDLFMKRVRYLNAHRDETSRDEMALFDGRIFDRYSAPMFGQNRRYYGRVWFYRDITENKRAQERWISTFEAIDDPICITDNDRRILICNKAMARQVKKPVEKIIGRRCCELMRKVKKPVDDCPLACMLKSRKREYLEGKIQDVWVRETAYPLMSAEGAISGAVNIFIDITEARQNHEAIVRKNIALEEVIAQVEIEKEKLRENISANVNKVILPILEKMAKQGGLPEYKKLLERSLKELTSSFGKKITTEIKDKLTAKEIDICAMIRAGMKNKEIAAFQKTAISTVETERKIIRNKLRLTNKKTNLATFLQNIR